MLSATILVAVWALFLNWFGQNRQEANSGHSELLWSILFGCSIATVSSIYLLQINILPSLAANQWVLRLEISASLAYIVFSLLKKSLARKIVTPFTSEFKTTKLLILTGITFLFLFSMLTSAPLNWDSNAYNVARVSTFLSSSSSILGPSTASARQAIYSVGHDILLYPDISFGMLRGLPTVSLLEFVVLLGSLLGITNAISLAVFGNKLKALKATGLITTILLFNSHQQVMQALITKNDLAVTLLFTISIAIGLTYLCEQQRPLNDKINMSSLVFMLSAAINIKSYGIILMIPTCLTAIIVLARRISTSRPTEQKAQPDNPSVLHKLLIILSISTLASFSIQTTLVHQAWLSTTDNRIASITSAWTNREGTWSERLENSLVNSGRILLQGSLFPYTTLKPYLPLGPELKSPIDNSFIPGPLQGSKGTHGGEFSLLYGTNPDMAYPFFGFQVGLILGLIGWCISRPQNGLASALFTVTASGLTFMFFSTALLYQPWISRFMGPVYIPLIPLASTGVYLLIRRVKDLNFEPKSFQRNLMQASGYLMGILPLLSSTSLTGYLSRRAGMPQDPSGYHEQYLWDQRGMTKSTAKKLISILKSNKFKSRILCSDDGPWTLVPMVLSQASKSYKNNVEIWHNKECAKYLRSAGSSLEKLEANDIVNINGVEIVRLP